MKAEPVKKPKGQQRRDADLNVNSNNKKYLVWLLNYGLMGFYNRLYRKMVCHKLNYDTPFLCSLYRITLR